MEIGFEPMILADRLMRPTGITKLPYSIVYNLPALSVSGIDRRTDHACAEIYVVAGLTHEYIQSNLLRIHALGRRARVYARVFFNVVDTQRSTEPNTDVDTRFLHLILLPLYFGAFLLAILSDSRVFKGTGIYTESNRVSRPAA